MIGVPSPPNATGAVLAISVSPAAYSGGNPAPINSAPDIATGVPNPAAPSKNAPKLKAIKSACNRRSGEIDTTDALTLSNDPASTVRTYRKTAVNTIQPIGNKPKHAPKPAAAIADFHGMPYTPIAIASAVNNPAAAARGADHPANASAPNKMTTGAAAARTDNNSDPVGL